MIAASDTIAAIATAPGRGGVAVIRVSGEGAFSVAEALTGRPPVPGRISLSKIRSFDPPHGLIDEGIVLAFKSPHSYTGEDVVEFQCHGGSVTPRRVLEACFAAGARLAGRGEFTARAYFNGRIGIEAAEGVIDLVDAKTELAADEALRRLGGGASRAYRALYDEALAVSAEIEHSLDVDESELSAEFWQDVAGRVKGLAASIREASRRRNEGMLLRDGSLVVLAGPPNAGKSSLMNALLGTDRAIVSARAGTTRDSIEEWLDVEGWPVRLTDTAGLRGTDDAVEGEGVRRSRELIGRADVVLALDCEIPGAVRIHSKCDLSRGEGLNVSALTGEGLDELRHAIAVRVAERAAAISEAANPGERESSLLFEAQAALEFTSDPVLLANSVRSCSQALGRLVGAVYSDDLLDALFSRFCVGK